MCQSILAKATIITLCPLMFACHNPSQDSSQTDTLSITDTDFNTERIPNIDSPIWKYDYNADTLIRVDSADDQQRDIEEVLGIINKMYEDKVELTFISQNNDTITVKIDHPEMLTQQMGTTGAKAYLTLATFTLTEQTGINYVTFHFKEGDHASPGTYSRKSF